MIKLKCLNYVKPFIPRPWQVAIRRELVRRKLSRYKDLWPIDPQSARPPEGWAGWPDGKKFALVLTHDVDAAKGLEHCQLLAEIEERHGFRSSFNFVAMEYQIPKPLCKYLADHGFEIGVHGLYHENPFLSKPLFRKQAVELNRFLKNWGSVGFRSPSMYHDLDLLHHLNIEYDSSTFDTDPFEPQPDGVGTIFPFWVSGNGQERGYVELPYTLPHDFLLFILMRESGIDIWKKKLAWIVGNGGMALFITHPDYMNFDKNLKNEEFQARHYVQFLTYIKSEYEGQYWHVLPKKLARWWADRYRGSAQSHDKNITPVSAAHHP